MAKIGKLKIEVDSSELKTVADELDRIREIESDQSQIDALLSTTRKAGYLASAFETTYVVGEISIKRRVEF